MGLRETFLNALGATQPIKQDNAARRSARDFLINGNRGDKLYPTWSDIKMPDSDMYSGYSYAVIQKRGNKVASLAKDNLKTLANQEIVDEYQKKEENVLHPYLKVIEDSSDFTEKQFWKNISIYLDLAGRYYLGVVRGVIRPNNPKLPIITTDPTKFIMLNPYEIRRVVDKNKNVAGYIERKKDGRYREWPAHQIIEMRELDPFDPENGHWAMTDAAKDAVYTINQSGDYTRQSLNGNIDAPGIITTDVLLNDNDFANFRARVTQHTKGEPLFGNGTGAIKWDSMQIDLDKAALMDINEINRTTLFAVSGTSKTSLGIEQSGTTRETARVQSEQFISDTAQPRLEDIVDFLNLDYKKNYPREYKQTGYKIQVQSAVGRDYDTEQKSVALKQSQFQLAMTLIQSGYTEESAWQFAEGEIEHQDLELEKGLDKPKISDEGNEEEGSNENNPNSPSNGPQSGSGSGNGSNTTSENNSLETADKDVLATDLNELEPHGDLLEGENSHPLDKEENGGKGSGNYGHAGRPGEVGGSGPGVGVRSGERIKWGGDQEFGDERFIEKVKKQADAIEQEYGISLGHSRIYKKEVYENFTRSSVDYDAQSCFTGSREIMIAFADYITKPSETTVYDIEELSWETNDFATNMTTKGIEGVIKHELGHAAIGELAQIIAKNSGKNSEEEIRQVYSELNSHLEKTGKKAGGSLYEEQMSSYGFENKLEAVAESIANPNYSPVTKAISNEVKNIAKKVKANKEIDFDDLFKNSKENVLFYLCKGNKGFRGEEKNQCTCEHDHKVETLVNELQDNHGKVVKDAYDEFLSEIREIEKETIDACVRKVNVNAFEEDDIIGKRKKKSLIEKLKNALHKYWWVVFPTLANNSMSKRNKEFSKNIDFVFNNDLKVSVDDNAKRVSEGHMETILGDVLEASNKAYTEVLEDAAAELIVKVYDDSPSKWEKYFEHKPTKADALDSIRRTDILEENRRIYERANTMAFEGYNRRDIIKAIRNEYKDISEKRATLIARNETARAFGKSQFEADRQFLNGVGKLDQAYKRLKSRRPENEKDKICPFCSELIERTNANPVPFEQPILKYGESMEVIEDGKVKVFTANYEDIQGSNIHPNCLCFYELVFKNSAGEFVKTLNGGKGSGNFGHAGRKGEVGGSASKGSFTSGEELFNAKMDDKLEAFRNLTSEEQAVFCEKAMEIDYKDMPQDLADTDFQRISYALGIKDKPKTVSDKEFKELVESGETEYFRCVKDYYKLSSKEIAGRLSTGEYTYQGNGDYCDGTYFTPDWGAMTAYSNSDSDSVIRSTIDLDANIYYSEARQPFDAKMVSVMKVLAQKTGMKQNTARAVALIGAGYDGWSFISGGTNKEYLCMLNRKHLTVNNENFSIIRAEYERSDNVE